MRVLLVSVDMFSYGGIQRYSRFLLAALRRSPLVSDVHVASLSARGSTGFTEWIEVDVTGRGRSILDKAWFTIRTLWLARARRADIVVVDHVYLAPIAHVYRLLTGTPYWLNVYAIEVWGPLSFLRRRALLGAQRIVSDCEFTRRYLEHRYPALADRIDVVPDCVDIAAFRPPPNEQRRNAEQGQGTSRTDRRVVLTVSRLAAGRSKGHEAVMRALAVLRERRIHATYVIAGDGPDRARLEHAARDVGIADAVVFHGAVADAELAGVYRSADVFVLASAFRMSEKATSQGEGVPLVTLEAQACGVPVITGRDDGSAESIIDGETGLLIDPNDYIAIADALERLLTDDALRASMAAAARALAVRQFSVEAFESRIGKVLAQFADEPDVARERIAA